MDFLFKIICRCGTIPFTWKEGTLSLQHHGTYTLQYINWTILLLGLCFKYYKMFELIERHDINALFIFGTIFVGYAAVGICMPNIIQNRVEMVEVIIQSQKINSSWGKQ